MAAYDVISFECVDVSQMFDSMLAGHDATIATLVAAAPEGNYTVQLETAGEINVEYNGERYYDSNEFSDELKTLISATHGDCLYDGSIDGLDCWANNWFQIVIFDPDNNFVTDDPPIVEGGLDMLGEGGIREELMDALDSYLDQR